jgi:hypothetical protein
MKDAWLNYTGRSVVTKARFLRHDILRAYAVMLLCCASSIERGGQVAVVVVAASSNQEGRAASNPPVDKRERIAELLDTLIVRGVARDEFQAVGDGNGGNHRVATANRATDAIQVASDLTS